MQIRMNRIQYIHYILFYTPEFYAHFSDLAVVISHLILFKVFSISLLFFKYIFFIFLNFSFFIRNL